MEKGNHFYWEYVCWVIWKIRIELCWNRGKKGVDKFNPGTAILHISYWDCFVSLRVCYCNVWNEAMIEGKRVTIYSWKRETYDLDFQSLWNLCQELWLVFGNIIWDWSYELIVILSQLSKYEKDANLLFRIQIFKYNFYESKKSIQMCVV